MCTLYKLFWCHSCFTHKKAAMYPFIHIYHSEIADLAIPLFRRIPVSPNPLDLKHLLISWPSKSSNIFCHISHPLIMEPSTLSSQPISSQQSSWRRLLPFKIKGVRNLHESKIELTIDNIPLRVIGFSFRSIWNLNYLFQYASRSLMSFLLELSIKIYVPDAILSMIFWNWFKNTFSLESKLS